MKTAQTGKAGAGVSAFFAMMVCLLVSPSVTASSLFDGNSANSWIINTETGEAIGSFDLGSGIKWSNEVFRVSNSTIEVGYDPTDSNQLGGLDLESQSVLINQTANSLPRKSNNLPDVSLIGIGFAIGSVGQPDSPAVELSPKAGVFDKTIGLAFTATVGRNINPETPPFVAVHWIINGGDAQQFDFSASVSSNLTHTIYLVDDGVYSIEFWASQNGNVAAHQTQTYTLLAEEGPRRDTDGDGIPDKWEAENGLDPLQDSSVVDSDGDGWSDFDEIIRGSDPFDSASTPSDTDLDGWSDFDEQLRDTNPNDIHAPTMPPVFPDKPTARRLYEVETQLQGGFYKDALETVNQHDMDALSVMDVFGDLLYLQRTLPKALELAALVPPLLEADLPLALQKSKVETALAQGVLPQGLRVPVGNPIVIRGVHLDATTGERENWAVKAWVDSSPDLHPRDVTDYLDGLGMPWETSQDWEDGFNAYLESELVREAAINLSPKSGLGIHLLEAAITWASEFSAGEIGQLGEPGIAPDQAAIEYLVNSRLRVRDEGLSDLHTQLSAAASSDIALLPFAEEIEAIYNNIVQNKITFRAGALLVQGNTANQDYVYALRLITYFGLDELNGLGINILTSLKVPANDTDLDGVSNQDELGRSLDRLSRATNPLLIDTDGDFINDRLDVCPLDDENKCLLDGINKSDSDGDGIIDPLDVCPYVSDPLQEDSNQDGIGDACRFYANITYPITDQIIMAGSEIDFNSIVTELGANKELVYNWNFDGGAVDSTIPNPGRIQFSQPGIYNISLIVTDNVTALNLGTDSRLITVLQSLVEPKINDVVVDEDAAPTQIELNSVFFNGASSTIMVEDNSNSILVSSNLVGTMLTLSYQPNGNGIAEITIRATKDLEAIEKAFTVTVNAVNDAPVFTSSSQLQLKNGIVEVDQVTASDIEDDSISFLLMGGVDSALFTLTADGLLNFIIPPDIDNPIDFDTDGDYELIIQAYDGVDVTEQAITVTADDMTADCNFYIIPTANAKLAVVCL